MGRCKVASSRSRSNPLQMLTSSPLSRRRSGPDRLARPSRSADLLLSTVAAEVVSDRLALAGIVMVRWSAPADSGEA